MPGSSPAAWRRPRNLLRAWHRWFGLLGGAWLILLALTGSAVAFYGEIDTWLNPDWRRIPLAEAPVRPAVDKAIASARAELPDFEARYINVPNTPGETISATGAYNDASGKRIQVQIYAHPGTGALLGWRDIHQIGLDRRNLMGTIYALHVDLALGTVGEYLIGVIALLWLVDHIPAVILAVPRLKQAASAFLVSGRGLRRLYDLHRAPGMWLFPITLVLAVSSVALTWPIEVIKMAGLFPPHTERLHYEMPDLSRPTGAPAFIGIDRALERHAQQGGAEADILMPLEGKGLYAIRSFDPRDIDDMGRLWTYVSASDGRIVAQRHDNGETAADLFMAWMYPLHSGRAFGLAGSIVICLSGIGVAMIVVTGYVLWFRRSKTRAGRTPRVPSRREAPRKA